MARSLIVEVIADPRQYIRGLDQASRASSRFGREMERSGKGVAVATLGVKGLGRSLASLSAPFVGGLAAGEVIRSVIDAGNEAAASQKQLQAQLKASGISFGDVKKQIDDADLSLSRISGFTADQLEQSFTTLVRATGDVNRALILNKTAADVARGRNIPLAQAAIALAKAWSGSLTSLRRLGIEIPKGTSRLEALRIVAERYAGQGAAGATVTDHFHAALQNTAAIIGQSLLPVFNKYLAQFTVWLQKLDESGRLQKDVNSFVKDATPIFEDAGKAIGFAAAALHKYGDALGYLRGKSKSSNPTSRSEADIARLILDPGYGIGKVIQTGQGIAGLFSRGRAQSPTPPAALDARLKAKVAADFARQREGSTVMGVANTALGFISAAEKLAAGAAPTARQGATVAQRNTWFDQMISRLQLRAGYLPALKQQLAAWQRISQLLTARIAVTKDVTRKANLEDQLLAAGAQTRQIRQQIAQNDQQALDAAKRHTAQVAKLAAERAKAAKEAAKAAAAAAAERAQKAKDAAVEAAQVAVARTGLTDGLQDDLAANKKLLAVLRRTHASAMDIVNQQLAIKSVEDQIAQNAKDAANAADKANGNTRVLFKHLSGAQFAAEYGAGLTAEQRRRIAVGYAMAGYGGGAPAGRAYQFTSGVVINGGVHMHGVQDVAGLENQIAKRAKARPHVRRGARG